jgi:hypothetical protein
LFRREIEFFLEIQSQGGESTIVGEALEDFADVGDPEGAVKAVANFLEALGKSHARG